MATPPVEVEDASTEGATVEHGGRGGFGHGGGGGCSTFQQGVFCQVCGKEGHPALHCYKRFDTYWTTSKDGFLGNYVISTNWCMDTKAMDHIISELEKLTTRDKYQYNGGNQAHTASVAQV